MTSDTCNILAVEISWKVFQMAAFVQAEDTTQHLQDSAAISSR